MADKRERRTRAEIVQLRRAIAQIVEQHGPLTVRHVFYLMVAARLIEKTEDAYRNVVIRLAGIMREEWLERERNGGLPGGMVDRYVDRVKAGEDMQQLYRELAAETDALAPVIPFGKGHIVDAGRWVRKPETHSGPEAALRNTARYYRRDLWADQDVYVAFFCEKDTIAEIVFQETAAWDVPLAVMRGDCSKTFLWENAKAIEDQNKPAFLYFLGDYDVKGRQIIESAVERVCRYARGAEISYEILAITKEQVTEYDLPWRPEKTDSSKQAVELDALSPKILRELINTAIEQHIPPGALEHLRVAEESERQIMMRIVNNLPAVETFLTEVR